MSIIRRLIRTLVWDAPHIPIFGGILIICLAFSNCLYKDYQRKEFAIANAKAWLQKNRKEEELRDLHCSCRGSTELRQCELVTNYKKESKLGVHNICCETIENGLCSKGCGESEKSSAPKRKDDLPLIVPNGNGQPIIMP